MIKINDKEKNFFGRNIERTPHHKISYDGKALKQVTKLEMR